MRIARKFDFKNVHKGLNQTFDDILIMLQNLDKLNFQTYPNMEGVQFQNITSIDITTLTVGDYTITQDEIQYIDGIDQSLSTTDTPTFDDLTITTPVNIYALSHDSFADTHNLTTDIDHDQLTNFESNEHVAHTGTNLVSQIADRILTYANDVLCYEGDILYA